MSRQATNPASLPEDIRVKLLLAREACIAGDINEANHWLYAIACPGFLCLDPWAALEGRQCACGPHPMLMEQTEVLSRLTPETKVEGPGVLVIEGQAKQCLWCEKDIANPDAIRQCCTEGRNWDLMLGLLQG